MGMSSNAMLKIGCNIVTGSVEGLNGRSYSIFRDEATSIIARRDRNCIQAQSEGRYNN
jgi:hypothetical protein